MGHCVYLEAGRLFDSPGGECHATRPHAGHVTEAAQAKMKSQGGRWFIWCIVLPTPFADMCKFQQYLASHI